MGCKSSKSVRVAASEQARSSAGSLPGTQATASSAKTAKVSRGSKKRSSRRVCPTPPTPPATKKATKKATKAAAARATATAKAALTAKQPHAGSQSLSTDDDPTLPTHPHSAAATAAARRSGQGRERALDNVLEEQMQDPNTATALALALIRSAHAAFTASLTPQQATHLMVSPGGHPGAAGVTTATDDGLAMGDVRRIACAPQVKEDTATLSVVATRPTQVKLKCSCIWMDGLDFCSKTKIADADTGATTGATCPAVPTTKSRLRPLNGHVFREVVAAADPTTVLIAAPPVFMAATVASTCQPDDKPPPPSKEGVSSDTGSPPHSVIERPSSRGGCAFDINFGAVDAASNERGNDDGSSRSPTLTKSARLKSLEAKPAWKQKDSGLTSAKLAKKLRAAERRRLEHEEKVRARMAELGTDAVSRTALSLTQELCTLGQTLQNSTRQAAENRERHLSHTRDRLKAKEARQSQILQSRPFSSKWRKIWI